MSDEDEPDLSLIGRIGAAAKQEGLTEGTKEYDKRRRQLHVIQCREMRGYSACHECSYNDSCDLYISLKVDYLDT